MGGLSLAACTVLWGALLPVVPALQRRAASVGNGLPAAAGLDPLVLCFTGPGSCPLHSLHI